MDDTRSDDLIRRNRELLAAAAKAWSDFMETAARIDHAVREIATPSGCALFGMLGVFSEFERAMIRDRVMARLDQEGRGVRETARLLKISAAKVSEGPADFGDRVSGFLIGHAKRTIKLSSKVIPAKPEVHDGSSPLYPSPPPSSMSTSRPCSSMVRSQRSPSLRVGATRAAAVKTQHQSGAVNAD